MKYQSPSSIVTILLASLAATDAFVPLSNPRPVAIPSFSSLSFPAATTTKTMGVLQMRTNNDDGAGALSNFVVAASIYMAAITGSAILPPSPANAVDISPSIVQTMTTTTTIAAIDSTAPSLANFLFKEPPVAVVYSPKERTLETTSPTLAKFLNCKLIEEPKTANANGVGVNKVVSDSVTLVLNNKLIFLTGTVVTISVMFLVSYQFFLSQQPGAKKA